MFTFKKTKLRFIDCNSESVKNPAARVHGTPLKAVGLWIRRSSNTDPYATPSRPFRTLASQVFKVNPWRRSFYVRVDESFKPKRLRAFRNRGRYKHVFPRGYNRDAYIAEALFFAFYYKDLKFLTGLIKELFTDINFFKHRYLIYFLRSVLNMFNETTGSFGSVRGLLIQFSGKISQAGNSRKRRYRISCGQVATNHSSSYQVEKFQIKTFTGAIGCTLILASKL